MKRIVVSFAKKQKAEKYKDSIRESASGRIEIGEAWSAVGPPAGGWCSLLADADGLLLTGGVDVEPARYGEALDSSAGLEVDQARDAMEWDLLAAARNRRVPVLGICRGHQVVNSFLGGSLHQDLGALGPEIRTAHDPDPENRRHLAHAMSASPGSLPLQRLLAGSGPALVNSLHHQAVRRPGGGMIVAGVGPGGVIEATEHEDPSWWVWTVQWHPEELIAGGDSPLHWTLFESFLAAAKVASRGHERLERVR